ncbi:hypothetical protein [Maribacter sp. 2308TA10-17]|uniref:hypothetical protein n=1 Tax=Maribacter sp. 2308TA10-17 TaxID=3386276 RepID=UPI0039BD68FC
MSHKEKICNPALTSHIETCHEQHSYTPLVVNRGIWKDIPQKPGLKSIIASELEEKTTSIVSELKSSYNKKAQNIKNVLNKVFDKEGEESIKSSIKVATSDLKKPTFEVIDIELQNQLSKSIELAKEDAIKSSKGLLDGANPEKAIAVREEKIRELVSNYDEKEIKYKPIPSNKAYELEGLGMFFKESVCYRPEGFAYSPCGKEITIMPGEEIKESNVLTTIVKEDNSDEQTIKQEFTTTDKETDVETFTDSYEKSLKKETDIKLSREASFKIGIPIKKISLDLSGKANGSINFNKIINEVNKSSHTNTRTRFNEVVRKINTSSTNRSSQSFTSTDKYTHIRNWKNETDSPQTYVKRTSYCKTSVIHKRHDVLLAWSGCIDNPARDLCTPDNLDVRHAEDLQAIRDKWKYAIVPAEFGSEPKDENVETYTHIKDNNIGGVWYRPSISHQIRDGWFYIGDTADAHVDASVKVEGDRIESQPSHGATGTVTFVTRVDTSFTRKPIYTKISFKIRSLDAQNWHNKVNSWRNEQAQKEIEEFLATETEKLNKYLATDQARASMERRIMEDFYGVTPIEDCCRLIARLRNLFDFDNMGYSLLPSWNELGEGCQKAFPVNLYTAKCLHFYLPIHAGKESEAISLLASINAIPWSQQLAPQIFAYVQQIQNMRATLYNRLFDPTGWDAKFDQPKGYDMTKFDTSVENWSAEHESDLNCELLGAFTINVPCGERVDKRPLLCE